VSLDRTKIAVPIKCGLLSSGKFSAVQSYL
jgi:hypothetical protein